MNEHDPVPTPGYERTDASVRPVLIFTLGLSLAVTFVVLLMIALYDHLESAESASDGIGHPLALPSEPPAPRLQTATADDLNAHRAREDALLAQYGWVDRERGIVRLPIERAMELTAERGLPARK